MILEAELATEVAEEEDVVVRSGAAGGGEEEELVQELAATAVTAEAAVAAGGLAPSPVALGKEVMIELTEVGVDELLLLHELLKPLESGIPDREAAAEAALMVLFASRVFNRFASAVFVLGVTCVLLL